MNRIVSLAFACLTIACATGNVRSTTTSNPSPRPMSSQEVAVFERHQASVRGLQHAAFEASDVVMIDVPEECRGWWQISWNVMPPHDGSLPQDSVVQLGGRCLVTNSVSSCSFLAPPSHRDFYLHVSVSERSLPDQPYTCTLRVRRSTGPIVEYRPGRHEPYYTPMIPVASTDPCLQTTSNL